MKNKGFTLIELIGTIVILSIVVLIIIPPISNSLKKSVEDADKKTKQSIIMAAKSWASDNKDKLPTTVKLNILQEEGYIDDNLKLPSTTENINSACVEIKLKERASRKAYTYSYKDNCN